MASTVNSILLKIKGDASNLNKAIDSSIKKINQLNAAAKKATAPSTTTTQPGQGMAQSATQTATDSANNVASIWERSRKRVDGAISGINRAVTTMSKPFLNIQKVVQNVGDSMRLLAQSISTVGRVMTFLISAPLGLFLKNQAEMAINFEEALTRVRKVTGLATKDMGELKDGLRDLAINTSTSHMELAGVAEVIGQMGFKSVKTIVELTEVFNMFSISTGIAADEAATNLSRIGNAFGWTKDNFVANMKSMANVINIMENTNAANAAQIMRSVAAWAQQAEQLNISEHAAAAFSATLISMGFTASESGTALRRGTAGMIKHADAVATAMGAIEGYGTAQEVLTKINENALEVMLDIIEAAKNGSNQAMALAEMLEIGGARGGRAFAALSQNIDLMRRNMEIARLEWTRNTSLIQEYELAMTSTANQMKLLKNNLNDVGITIGDAILPTLNQLIMVLVAALRMANDWFKGLDDATKRMYVFGAIALVALGPALFMFGQLASAVSLVALGAGRLLLLVPQLFSGIGYLLTGVLTVGKAFLGWPAIVLTAIVGIIKILAEAGVDIAGFFIDLGNRAKAWGERLAETYASGFLAGAVRYIAAAIQWVANMIASFFKGASPPKRGPLSTIDKWGSKVMETYLEGFGKADFSILSKVGKTIENVLTRGLEGTKLADALEGVAGAKVTLSKLISKFNETGIIDNSMLRKVTQGLGPIADNVRSLIKDWLKYNEVQERIAALEERRKQVKRTYTDELKAIAGTTMGIKDKVAAIREAQRQRDDNLRGLTEEQEKLEEQRDELKENVDHQQAMIDAMTEQDNLLQRIIDTLKQVAEAAEEAFAGGGSFGDIGTLGEMPDVDDVFEKALSDFKDLQSRLAEGRDILQGFLDAWRGDPPEDFGPTWLVNADPAIEKTKTLYDQLYDIGLKAREIYDTVTTWKDAFLVFIGEAKAGFEELLSGTDFEGMIGGAKDFDITEVPFIKGLMEGLDGIDPDALEKLSQAFEDLKNVWGLFNETVFGGEFDWETIGKAIGDVIDTVIEWATYTLAAIMWLISAYMLFIMWLGILKERFTETKDHFINTWGEIIENFWTVWDGIKNIVYTAFTVILIIIKNAIENIKTIIDTWGELLKAIWEGRWSEVGEILSTAWETIKTTVSEAIASVSETISTYVDSIKLNWETAWDAINTFLSEKWEAIKTTIETTLGEIQDAIESKLEEVQEFIETVITEVMDWIDEQYDTMYEYGEGLINGLWEGIKKVWQSLKTWAETNFGWLIDLIASVSDSDSPSKVLEKQGKDLMEGLEIGLRKGMTMPTMAISDINQALSITPSLMPAPGFVGGSPAPGAMININVNDPVVRDDTDIDEIVRKVSDALARQVNTRIAFGGTTTIG